MASRSNQSAGTWEEFPFQGRSFIRAIVPRGDNEGQKFEIAKTVAGRYEIKGFFRSGGCGLLLRGRDQQTETDVLIKTTLRYDVVYCARGRDVEGFRKAVRQARQQLQTERRIMVQLKNRGCNAIPNPNDYVFDWNPKLAGPYACDHGGDWQYDEDEMLSSEPYLVMEQVDGCLLTDEIRRDGMEERRALRIMSEICHVLKLLHRPVSRRRNIWKLVYQDLKPDNIMIGAQDAALLLDFGGCRLTVDGQIANQGAYTPGYCPPECEGGELSPASDSWTVGSTLYQMLTGLAPSNFLKSELAGSAPRHVAQDEWDWNSLHQRVRQSTFDLIQGCLRTSPAERPADADSLCQHLNALL
jgi:serine/threonine protein kinase